MGRGSVQPRHGGVHHVVCNACRSARPPPHVRRRRGRVHRRVDRLRARAVAHGAQRRARRPGRGRRNGQRDVARAGKRRVRGAQGEGARDRHLGRDRRRGERRRTYVRRLSRRIRRMAGDLLGQRAGRDRRDRADAAFRERIARRPPAHARPRRPGPVHGHGRRVRLRRHRGPSVRMDAAAHPRLSRDRGRRVRGASCVSRTAPPIR